MSLLHEEWVLQVDIQVAHSASVDVLNPGGHFISLFGVSYGVYIIRDLGRMHMITKATEHMVTELLPNESHPDFHPLSF